MKKDISLRVKKSGEGMLSVTCGLTIEKAEEFKTVLLKALEKTNKLVVNFKRLTDADLTCIQLLCSANRTFSEENKQLLIQDKGGSDVLDKVLRDASFNVLHCMSEKYCKKCLWKEAKQNDENDNGSR